MTLSKDEYMIKGDSIILPKKTLERWRDHYQSIADANCDSKNPLGTFKFSYYNGKTDILTELLKLFEPLEG